MSFFTVWSQSNSLRFFHRRSDSLGNGRKWMKWHVRRPGSSLGMCMEHVEGILAQFDDIFHGLVADDIYTLFSTANQIFSEMAENG